MKNIIVITDRANMADLEFKSLRQKLTDKGLLIKADAFHWYLCTSEICIRFWSTNSPFPIITSDTFAYSNCNIGIRHDEPIISQIRKWKMIERLIVHLPSGAEEIPYSDVDNLKILETDRFEVKE